MSLPTSTSIRKAAQLIQQSDCILISAGAGFGVDSGLPDFRGKDGFWKAYPPMKDLGLQLQDMSNPQWFKRDPSLAWGFFGHRFKLYTETTPHDGFQVAKRIMESRPHQGFVFTSNVDGQFQKAGFDSNRIVECHGSITHVQCTVPCNEAIYRVYGNPDRIGKIEEDIFPLGVTFNPTTFKADLSTLPHCPHCKSLMRPNILMFNDVYWIPNRTDQQEKTYNEWMLNVISKNLKVVVLEFGAGTAIPTVRFTGEQLTRLNPSNHLIRVNPRDDEVPGDLRRNYVSIKSGSLVALQQLDLVLKELQEEGEEKQE